MNDETLHKANELKKEIKRLDQITSKIFYNSFTTVRRIANKFIFQSRPDDEFNLKEDEIQVLERYLYEKWARLEREYKEL